MRKPQLSSVFDLSSPAARLADARMTSLAKRSAERHPALRTGLAQGCAP